jgi:hypothetical protein
MDLYGGTSVGIAGLGESLVHRPLLRCAQSIPLRLVEETLDSVEHSDNQGLRSLRNLNP